MDRRGVARCLICGAAHARCGPDHLVYPPVDLGVIMADTRYTADRRLYLDADGNVVEADNPARRTLLVAAGGTLDMDTARRYGLVADPDAEKALAAPPANKAQTKPPANKGKDA